MLKKVLIVLAVILLLGSFLTVLGAGLFAAVVLPWSSTRSMTPAQVVEEAGVDASLPVLPTYTPYVTAPPAPTYTPYVTAGPAATETPYVPSDVMDTAAMTATVAVAKKACTNPVTLTSGADGRITFQGVSFVLPPELGKQVEAWECTTPLIDPYDPWVSHPVYVAFRFPTDRERIYAQPELRVNRVEGDMTGYLYPMSELGELRGALNQKPEPADSWFKAPLKTRGSYVNFTGGQGVRAVVEYAQDFFFFTNNALLYDYHSLTDDGRYYVHLYYPIAAPFLLDIENSNPATNFNPQAIPVEPWSMDFEKQKDNIAAYNAEALRRFAQMSDSEFTPDLGLIDQLIASLKITR